eukprot:TRINITY_DN416_c0_g1_i1.p1 TRINITY_DN416_c0_g1~~TRINITY_DN416_c0_g1_i1.p1  ORF type:complete len:612 (+),score=61.98 TRINITY_DN416_c0_g1_i1:176-1837(+)
MYQSSNWSEVWRALCLQRWNGHFTFRISWKITTLFPDANEAIPDVLLPSPSKLDIKGFFSDLMYQRWWYSTHCTHLAHWEVPWDEDDGNDEADNPRLVHSAHPKVNGARTSSESQLPGPLAPYPRAGPPPNLMEIDRIPISSISVEEFKARYLAANRPVILTGVTDLWRGAGASAPAPTPASDRTNARRATFGAIDMDDDHAPQFRNAASPFGHTYGPESVESSHDGSESSDGDEPAVSSQELVSGVNSPYMWSPEQLAIRFETELFKINSYNQSGRRVKMTMKDYVHYMRTNTDAFPLYIFDSKFGERCPDMLRDYDVPPHFWEDLFAALPEDSAARPPHRWIVMGPTRSGTPFHTDPNGTSAWNALMWGRKRWALYPPTFPGTPPPPGVHPKTLKAPHPLIWWQETYPHLPSYALPPMEFIQEAGDFLFVPSGWWHTVLNLTDTVAVTQNFVNIENLDAVVFTMMREGREKLVEFWKRRLMPLRPELFFRISNQQRMLSLEQQAQNAAHYRQQLKREKKKRRQLEDQVRTLQQQLAALSNAGSLGQPSANH